MKSRLSHCYWSRCWFTTNVLSNYFTLLSEQCSQCNYMREESDFIKGSCRNKWMIGGWAYRRPKNSKLFFKTELFLIYLTSNSDKGPFISRDVRVSKQFTIHYNLSLYNRRVFPLSAWCQNPLKRLVSRSFELKALTILYLCCWLCFIRNPYRDWSAGLLSLKRLTPQA